MNNVQTTSSRSAFLRRYRRLRLQGATFVALVFQLLRGRIWLVPLVLIFGLTACLLVVVSVIESVAPFVYTIF